MCRPSCAKLKSTRDAALSFSSYLTQGRLYTFEGPSAKLMMWIHKWICTQTINHIWVCLGTCNRQSWCKFGYMGQRCCFSYFQSAKQIWTVEFTINIFTGMGPLWVWALGLCTYRTPLESALISPCFPYCWFCWHRCNSVIWRQYTIKMHTMNQYIRSRHDL
jgi:hypothetical protein